MSNRQILGDSGPSLLANLRQSRHLLGLLTRYWSGGTPTAEERHKRDYYLEAELQQLLPEFLLRTPTSAATQILQPILDSIDRHPREDSLVGPWVDQR